MAKPISIDPYTSAVTPLDMYFNDQQLSRGTAFFWRSETGSFLVTNWHNVTGRNPQTCKHLSKHAGEPNKIHCIVYKGGNLNQRFMVSLELYEKDQPVWLEHPKYGREVDVVCVPVELPDYTLVPINSIDETPVRAGVGDDVFVLGFPKGIDIQGFPLWKRASVASEPDFDVGELPKLLVDTATAEGMSGSPVIRRTNMGQLDSGKFHIGSRTMTRFVGIYSGRLASDHALEAQLGIVWKASVIEEIIKGGRRGKMPPE